MICCCFTFADALTANERSFLSGEYVFAIGAEDYPPYEYIDEGKLTGFHIELIRAVAEKNNLDITFERYPFKRAQQMLKTGKIDAFTYYGRTAEREKDTRYLEGNILHTAKIVYVVLKSRADEIVFNGNLELLSDYRIVTQAGFSYGHEFDSADYLKKYAAPSLNGLKDLLLNGRGDLGIVYLSDFYSAYKDTAILDKFTIVDPPVLERPMYIGFSKKADKDNISVYFAEKMEEYKATEEYEALYNKYFSEE
ncbi:transporter substrate-binding domain-containing protein [uncultured Kiloniella sp.]|uniref:substrate-binding periplasmic protein n=1 Tax=uncultured Kiloniella sp. TaxID=1133091 RepID=UPI00261F92A5|nr:transporter substrate-binding domain-containing protein [uncultured Kiloniella sp.]